MNRKDLPDKDPADRSIHRRWRNVCPGSRNLNQFKRLVNNEVVALDPEGRLLSKDSLEILRITTVDCTNTQVTLN